ncbi:hypothetical protein GXP67_14145 [Rhodocytophaga rosea]|uniref:DUF5050 domain-containing protein n=1 Tax=Rhodocytophaga rosea TaxID=2704465 RepID=A0A6C0GIZ7_9BACT|nr:DPP IV N-terminal domain-containing protein [Rhodocytophaga rosea]QHT67690.1 hypothetical protein GXP67_14145 [Rhodocytophaga rosea]
MRTYAIVWMLLAYAQAFAQSPTVLLSENGIENAYPRLSKDGKRILYQSNRTGTWQLYVMTVADKSQQRLTNDTFNNNFPDWSADNEWIAFVSDRDGNEEIYLMKPDGTSLKRLTQDTSRDIHPYFSPDRKYLLFNSDREGPSLDIYRYTLETGQTERLIHSSDEETCARYSPDMKTLVLLKNNQLSDDIFLVDASSKALTNLSNTPNVYHGWPVFSADGQWIYYSSMEKGTYSIYRIKPDGTAKQQLTKTKSGEEHARVSLSAEAKLMVYNIKQRKTISIVSQSLENIPKL